jgi:hypothetical protein
MKIRYRGFTMRPFIRLTPIAIGSTRLYCWGPIALFVAARESVATDD